MATPRLGSFLDGLSGRMGNVVFSERYGKTVMGRRPRRKCSEQPKTPRRRAVRLCFEEC